MLLLPILLLFSSGTANDNRTSRPSENRQLNECAGVDGTLNKLLFSSLDKHEAKELGREEPDFEFWPDLGSTPRKSIFVRLQLDRLHAKWIQSRALRSARRLSIAADCLRPAVVCIASVMTCLRWGDTDYEVYEHNTQERAQFLTSMGNIKGAVMIVVKNRKILANMNWFSRYISPRGTMEDSDCVFLVTDSKEDALLILSEGSWRGSARYVVVIMDPLSHGEYNGGLYEEGTEEGEDIDDVVAAEFDLNHYEAGPSKTMDASRDLWRRRRRRRRRRDLSKWNSTSRHEKCSASAHNLLRLLWYNCRLLHAAVIRAGCNISSTVGYIQGNVSTTPIYLLSHSGEEITLAGDNVTNTLEVLRSPVTNLGGRSLRISLFARKPTVMLVPVKDTGYPKFAGQDAWLLRLTARYLNFRVVVLEPEDKTGFGHLFQNGTSSGTLRHLLHGKADISFNGFLVMDYGTRAVEFSSPVSIDTLCVVVPRAAALPRWAALLTTLPPIIIAITPPTIVCLTLILSAIRRLFHFRGSTVSDMLSVVSVCLGVSTRMPHLCSQRLLLIGATVAALVIAGAFQGLIVRSIAGPRYPTQIDTLKALDESGLYVATGSETFKNTFDVPGGSVIMEHLLKKTVVLTTDDEWDQRSGRVAILVRRAGVNLSPQEHLVKECPRQYPVAFLMRRGSPIENVLDDLLLRYAAAGITKMFDYWTHGNNGERRCMDTPRKVFSLEDLEGPFIALVCGLGLSTCIFFYEIRITRWGVATKPTLGTPTISRGLENGAPLFKNPPNAFSSFSVE